MDGHLSECQIANALIEHGTKSTWPNSRLPRTSGIPSSRKTGLSATSTELAANPTLRELRFAGQPTNPAARQAEPCSPLPFRWCAPDREGVRALHPVPYFDKDHRPAFVLTLGNKEWFGRSRYVGCYLGLRPRRSQSGERDPQLGITKTGSGYLRHLLIEWANHILRPRGKDSALPQWGLHLAARGDYLEKSWSGLATPRPRVYSAASSGPDGMCAMQWDGRSSIGGGSKQRAF